MPGEVSSSEAPVGDIATAIMHVDGLLRRAHAAAAGGDGQADALPFLLSLDEQRDAFDGTCSLIYLFTTVFREAAEAEGEDVLADVVPELVRTLGYMKESVAPAVVPMMAAMVTAAALGMSPNLWRLRYGSWRPEDIKRFRRQPWSWPRSSTAPPAAATRRCGWSWTPWNAPSVRTAKAVRRDFSGRFASYRAFDESGCPRDGDQGLRLPVPAGDGPGDLLSAIVTGAGLGLSCQCRLPG
jgi:hypothetical protein